MNEYWVPCVRNSSYSTSYINSFEIHRCFGHGLNICMWFGYNSQIILSLFPQVELSHFSGIFTIKVNRKWVPCVRNSSYSFMLVLLKLHRCFGHGLKTCMWFGYNPQIRFCHFFRNLNLVFFQALIPCGGNSSHKVNIFR